MNAWYFMGGYAFYVWACYFIVIVVFIINFVLAHYEHKKINKTLRQLLIFNHHE